MQSLFPIPENARDTIIAWQRELTARPALGPDSGGAGEAEKAEWVTTELERLGLSDIRQYPCPDDRVPAGFRPNISARVPGKNGKTLWVISHLDVVPAGDLNLWEHPPFSLRVDGDLLYGRGVSDNQQAVTASMLAARALISAKIVPDYSLGLLFVADEENGFTYGLPHVLATAPELILPDDLVLVPDMGNARGDAVEIVEKGILWLRFTVQGRQCHASRPDAGINSLACASALIVALDALPALFSAEDLLFKPPRSTFAPTKKEANVENINTIPGSDVFYMDCRLLPQYSSAQVIEACRRIADELEVERGVRIIIEPVNMQEAAPGTSPDAPVVQRLIAALRELRGITPSLYGAGGLTEASYLRAKGIPAAAWATLFPTAHTPNEYASVEATIADAKVITRMLFDESK